MDKNIETGLENSVGSLKISQDVIATIAKIATLEIDGVDSVSTTNTGIKGLITKTNYIKPIKIDLSEEVVGVQISIVVKNGYKIPVLAEAVQQSVKNAIQSMTGLAVSRVDVIISGIAPLEVTDKE